MANLLVDGRDQEFILYEMLNVEELCQYPVFADFSRDMFDMVFTEAEKLSKEVIFPTLHAFDKDGAYLDKDGVHVPKAMHDVYKRYCEGGWLAMKKAPEFGGQGFPLVVSNAAAMWFRHNPGFCIYPGLTSGAARLIEVFGTDKQKETYVLKMNSGEWGGTMALTEPEAGSDVGEPEDEGHSPTGRFLSPPGDETVHYGGGSGPDGQHHQSGSGAH